MKDKNSSVFQDLYDDENRYQEIRPLAEEQIYKDDLVFKHHLFSIYTFES